MVRFLDHGNGQFDARHRIGPCAWPHFDLLTIRSGRVWIELKRGRRVELEAGQSILIYPHTPFRGETVAPTSHATVMHFHLRESAANDDKGLPHPLKRLVGRSEHFELYPARTDPVLAEDIQRAVRLAGHPDTPVYRSMREALLVLILGQLHASRRSRQTSPSNSCSAEAEQFAALLKWVTASLDQRLTLKAMAEFSGMSLSHFRAVFTRCLGESPGRFMQRTRYEEAARLLRETRQPIKQVARAVGFDDLAHFYRFFGTQAATTPRQYRLKHRFRG